MSDKTINCTGCTHKYECEPIAEEGGFRYWGCLLRYLYNGYKPKCLARLLIREAQKFLPEYRFCWSGGQCCCKAPYGDYIWHFAVRMKQETIWNYREFKEGRKFGRKGIEPFRSANPYIEMSRHESWDAGYILGLHEFEVKQK